MDFSHWVKDKEIIGTWKSKGPTYEVNFVTQGSESHKLERVLISTNASLTSLAFLKKINTLRHYYLKKV